MATLVSSSESAARTTLVQYGNCVRCGHAKAGHQLLASTAGGVVSLGECPYCRIEHGACSGRL